MKNFLMFAAVAMLATTAHAQTLDGSITGDESFYGAALSTQNTRTGFGDNTSDDLVLTATGGSEINQVFATISGGRLHVMVTGVLETNFNKLQLFFDTDTGSGVNSIVGADLPDNLDGFCCGGFSDPTGALERMDGLTFDTGFTANSALIITNGFETVNPGMADEHSFYAVSAHFADLDNGTSGRVGGLGLQTGPQGNNTVFRSPFDYNGNGTVDAADYTVWRDSEGQTGSGLPADGNGDEIVDATDYTNWESNFNVDASLSGAGFNPSVDFPTSLLLEKGSVALPGLSQGDLIDQNYAKGVDGGCTDDTGAGCIAPELEFVLPVDPAEIANNESSHRDLDNFVDLKLAIDNSELAGVMGDGNNLATVEADPGEAETSTTGIEFSIPLSEIGAVEGSGDDIRIAGFVNGGGHDFLSNQVIGEGVLDLNIGTVMFSSDPFPLTFDDFPGNQFVTVSNPASSASVPEPTAALLAVLAAVGFVARRK